MKDPGFVFYPGDYLRDTQCLSELVQVAYDRIMCEHMRNICISPQQLNFFTKKLNAEEKEELGTVLTKVPDGYQIDWVVDSISKRRAYSESRARNRSGKNQDKPVSNTKDIKTYVHHMDNEIENENENEIEIEKNGEDGGEHIENIFDKSFIIPEMLEIFKQANPDYITQIDKDYPALKKIADTLAKQEKIELLTPIGVNKVKEIWTGIVEYMKQHRLYKQFAIFQVEKYIQSIAMALGGDLNNSTSSGNSTNLVHRNTIQSNIEAATAAKSFLATRYSDNKE